MIGTAANSAHSVGEALTKTEAENCCGVEELVTVGSADVEDDGDAGILPTPAELEVALLGRLDCVDAVDTSGDAVLVCVGVPLLLCVADATLAVLLAVGNAVGVVVSVGVASMVGGTVWAMASDTSTVNWSAIRRHAGLCIEESSKVLYAPH